MKIWNRIEQFFKHKQLYLLEKMLGLDPIAPDRVDFKNIKRILVVRQHDQLGDFILSTPVFRALRQAFPKAFIAVVARSYTSQVLRQHPSVDQIVPFFEHGRDWTLSRIWQFVKIIRSGFDLAIVINTVSHSLTSDVIARMSKAKFILGSEHLLFGGTRRNFFYNLTAPYHPDLHRNQSERNLDILRYLGIDFSDPREDMTISQKEREWARNALLRSGWDGKSFLLGIHPGAGKVGNRWPAENFAQVARMLAAQIDLQIFVTWGPQEQDLGERVLNALPKSAIVITDGNIRRIAAVLTHINLFLCNDTGILHVAAAVETPLVVIFGPTDPRQWKPVGDNFVATRGADGRCDSVTPKEVFELAFDLYHRNYFFGTNYK